MVSAVGASGSFAVAAVIAVFSYRLWRIERQRSTPVLEILSAQEDGGGVRFVLVNKGGHPTALRAIRLIQEIPRQPQQLSQPAWDGSGRAAVTPKDLLIQPGEKVEVTVHHFVPPLWSNPGTRKRLRVEPVLGEPTEGPVDVNEVARMLREARERGEIP